MSKIEAKLKRNGGRTQNALKNLNRCTTEIDCLEHLLMIWRRTYMIQWGLLNIIKEIAGNNNNNNVIITLKNDDKSNRFSDIA